MESDVRFRQGATVILGIEVYITDTSTLVDPATSMRITIVNDNNGLEVDDVDMVKDSTGMYHYDFQTAGKRGKFRVSYTDTDGSRISKGGDEFFME